MRLHLRPRLALAFFSLLLPALGAGCNNQAGTIDVKQAPPAGIEGEIAPNSKLAVPKPR